MSRVIMPHLMKMILPLIGLVLGVLFQAESSPLEPEIQNILSGDQEHPYWVMSLKPTASLGEIHARYIELSTKIQSIPQNLREEAKRKLARTFRILFRKKLGGVLDAQVSTPHHTETIEGIVVDFFPIYDNGQVISMRARIRPGQAEVDVIARLREVAGHEVTQALLDEMHGSAKLDRNDDHDEKLVSGIKAFLADPELQRRRVRTFEILGEASAIALRLQQECTTQLQTEITDLLKGLDRPTY